MQVRLAKGGRKIRRRRCCPYLFGENAVAVKQHRGDRQGIKYLILVVREEPTGVYQYPPAVPQARFVKSGEAAGRGKVMRERKIAGEKAMWRAKEGKERAHQGVWVEGEEKPHLYKRNAREIIIA